MFKYTKKRSGYYKLIVDGVEVSQHIDPLEAAEHGEVALEDHQDAVVRVIHDYELWIEWADEPVAVDWLQASVVTIGPSEGALLSSAETVSLRIEPLGAS